MKRSVKTVLISIMILVGGIGSYYAFRLSPTSAPVKTTKASKAKKAKKVKAAAVVKVDCLALRMDKADQCCQDLISASGRKTCNRHLDRMITNALK